MNSKKFLIASVFFNILFLIVIVSSGFGRYISKAVTTDDKGTVSLTPVYSYYYSDIMENPIDQKYLLLINGAGHSESEIRNFQKRYYEIWKEEYHKALNILKNKAVYQEDKDNIEQFDQYVENYFDNNYEFYETTLLKDYNTDPSSAKKNSWGNGTVFKLFEIKGKIYRNACMQIIMLLDESDYQYPREIDFIRAAD